MSITSSRGEIVDQITQLIFNRCVILIIPRRRFGAIGDLDVFDRKRPKILA